jgi:poly(A) polymerase
VTGPGSIIIEPTVITAAEHGIDVQQLCPSATEVVRRLQNAGYEAYIVGGSVRDLLVGKVPKDFDVATDATPEEVKVVFPRSRLIGRRFRLAHVRLSGVLVEVATFRGQAGQASPHQQQENGRILRDNVWGSLGEDAIRRDFTINALFMDPVNGEIRDFVGGYEDLQNRILKLIGDPETRYREDPVRMLRAARFVAKLDVQPDPATATPIPEMAHLLEQIPPARLFEEVCKLFLTGHAEAALKALQAFSLTRSLFPVMGAGDEPGQALISELLWLAMDSTDRRIRQEKSVTPAFLYAALLWGLVRQRRDTYMENGLTEYQATEQAGEEALAIQISRTMLPRRFSSVTRQIWQMQARFRKTRGKRAMRVLEHQRFRAAYDFLLLRQAEEPDVEPLAEFWTQAQKDHPVTTATNKPGAKRRPRRRRGRRQSEPRQESA